MEKNQIANGPPVNLSGQRTCEGAQVSRAYLADEARGPHIVPCLPTAWRPSLRWHVNHVSEVRIPSKHYSLLTLITVSFVPQMPSHVHLHVCCSSLRPVAVASTEGVLPSVLLAAVCLYSSAGVTLQKWRSDHASFLSDTLSFSSLLLGW